MKHLQAIDGLRGVFALLVIFYHTSYWLHMPYPEWLMSMLRIWGIYGVEGFFVISGIALSLSTKPDQFNSLRGNFTFIVRRYSRILPLYVFLFFLYRRSFVLEGPQLFELSMLFGFVDPAQATLIAGWSIGVEFVFYISFPLLVLLYRNNLYRAGIVTILTAVLLAWYSTFFDSNVRLGTQNSLYVNPANHFLFFVTGCFFGVLYKHGSDISICTNNRCLLASCLIIFILMGIFGSNSDQVEVMVGYKRFVLSLMVVVMVGTLMYLNTTSRLAVLLGDISYAIYLLHPVVVFMLLPRIHLENLWFKLIIVFVISVPLSYLSHRYFEMPAQRLIRKIMHA